ncbi:MAG: hypothetical protein BGO97_04275 [Micrococcales bacterium 70-64]|nr:DUF998 domain-containing protein [Leifsonia sp.]ODU63324.1 MAG: hypothetical protein ABT06_04280 [Leifsonia sp. SCN 70-46]OJX85015.1 MAG: hypothetical protein BGO97_04275 [Micrococcales bacterium 70-64]
MRRAELVASVAGCLLVVAALVIIWAARLSIPRALYVSELGAEGMPTARWFQAALLLIVAGGAAIAWAGRRVRSRARLLRAWTPAVSLWIACALFLFASQVTCTAGCPLPYGDTFNLQDFLHTLAAVLAFAAACWAMLQSSFAQNHRVLAIFSRATGIAVAAIAGTGGLFSLFRFQVAFGSQLEFVATTLAIAWLVVFGSVLAARLALHEPQEAVG